MKMLLGFFIGMTVSLLIVLIMNHNTSAVSADSPPATVSADSTTSTDNLDVNGLMPDVGKIYRVALGEPYRQVKTEITDPDIARYYQKFMDRTGLDKIGAE